MSYSVSGQVVHTHITLSASSRRSPATAEIARIADHDTVKSHSKSQISVIGTNRKPICHFLLVNDTHLYSVSCNVSKLSRTLLVIFAIAFDGVSLFNAFCPSNLCEYRHKSYAKNYGLFAENMSLEGQFDVVGCEANVLGELIQNMAIMPFIKGHRFG